MTPSDINTLDDTEALIERLQEVCNGLGQGVSISTADLVNAAFPHARIVQTACFTILQRPPTAMEGYWTRGVQVRGKFGNPKRPYLWHNLLPICPHCRGTGRVAMVMPSVASLQRPAIDRSAIPALPRVTTWEEFDALDDADKWDMWGEMRLVPRLTPEDLEIYGREIERRRLIEAEKKWEV